MIAIVMFLIATVYLGVAVWAVVAAYRGTRASGMGKVAQWTSAGLVTLVFYLIPFWDWIPTVLAHRRLCDSEGKFQIHKTIDQWKLENKEALKDLYYNPEAKIAKVGDFHRFPLNQRLASERKDPSPEFLSIRRTEGRIVDVKTGEVLAQYTNFLTGYGPLGVGGEGTWKFWLDMGGCKGEGRGYGTFALVEQEIQKLRANQ